MRLNHKDGEEKKEEMRGNENTILYITVVTHDDMKRYRDNLHFNSMKENLKDICLLLNFTQEKLMIHHCDWQHCLNINLLLPALCWGTPFLCWIVVSIERG